MAFLSWLPHWTGGAAILVAATALAIALYAATRRALHWMLGGHHPMALAFLQRTRGPARLALIMLVWRITLEYVPFNQDFVELAGALSALALIALIGWIAIRLIDIASVLYLRRFRLDIEDNLLARKHVTQVRILKRTADTLIVIITVAAGLMTFESVRQYGVSLFASAGAAGLVVGFAARPVLSNLIAGIQIAVTQPIRVDDAVIVENEWGWVEEITSTYVVLKLWDWRRLVVPLSYFIEKPFQNWTRENASLIGVVTVHVDYAAPVDRIRRKLDEIVRASPLWDRQVVVLQVTDATPHTIELRALASARNAPAAFDLRCEVREKLIGFLQQEMPAALPRLRTDLADMNGSARSDHPLVPLAPEKT